MGINSNLMQNFILFKVTDVMIYQTKYLVYAFTALVSKLNEKIWFWTNLLCKY